LDTDSASRIKKVYLVSVTENTKGADAHKIVDTSRVRMIKDYSYITSKFLLWLLGLDYADPDQKGR
jgi:hypothetical protein